MKSDRFFSNLEKAIIVGMVNFFGIGNHFGRVNFFGNRRSRFLEAQYGGYTCCPLVTGYGKTIMAEFDYDGKPKSSFPFDPTQERWSMWMVKRHVLPWLYWNRMLKGEQFEPDKWKFLLSQ